MELQVKNNLRSTNLSSPLYSNCFELHKITTLRVQNTCRNVPVPKSPCTEMSTETKCPCAEIQGILKNHLRCFLAFTFNSEN